MMHDPEELGLNLRCGGNAIDPSRDVRCVLAIASIDVMLSVLETLVQLADSRPVQDLSRTVDRNRFWPRTWRMGFGGNETIMPTKSA
jgi:hypothetical protein